MSLHITPAMLEEAYNLFLTTLPFRRWKLPDPDDIVFRAIPLPNDDQGELFKSRAGKYRLTVSPTRHKTLASMQMTLAHEIAHIRQDQLGKRDHHGASFRRIADQICARHGFDRGQF